MLRKFAAVLIAATMFTAPVLAQNAAPATPAQTSQPAKTPVAKVKSHHVKKTHVKKHKVVKHTKKHHRQVRHVKPSKPSKKPMMTTSAPAKSAPTKSN